MSKQSVLVAVYGSLKDGFGNHRLLDSSEFIGVGETIESRFDMVSLGSFPGVIEGEYNIQVEVYKVSLEVLNNRLDNLEGYPTFYNREQIPIRLSNGEDVTSWMYYLNKDNYNDTRKVRTKTPSGSLVWTKARY